MVCYNVPYTYKQCMQECTSGENPGTVEECRPLCRQYKTKPWYTTCTEPMPYAPSTPYGMGQPAPYGMSQPVPYSPQPYSYPYPYPYPYALNPQPLPPFLYPSHPSLFPNPSCMKRCMDNGGDALDCCASCGIC